MTSEPQTTIEIRAATGEDAAPIAGLWTEAYVTLGVGGRSQPYTEDDFLDSADRGEVFVVDGVETVAGVVVLSALGAPGQAVAEPDEAELSRLAVAASSRGMGIGRALTCLCERRARVEGWRAIALWSRPRQVEAHRLYESLGYRRVPERDSVDGSGHGCLVFRLTLTNG
jgi:ribosomal protein S18 acetylase RimI-like enzyme